MDILNHIVLGYSMNEARHFKLLRTSMADVEGRKDLWLFDEIRKKKDNFSDNSAFKKLYPNQQKTAYYRLRNRLLDDVSKHIAFANFESGSRNKILQLLSVFQVFYNKSDYESAHYFLKLSYKQAVKSNDFSLLDIIYDNFVKLSMSLTEIDPELWLKKKKENAENITRLSSIDNALSLILYRLKKSQNYQKPDSSLVKSLQEEIKSVTEISLVQKNPIFYTRLFQALSQMFIQGHNFDNLYELSVSYYQMFEKEKWFDKNTHEVRIQMLIYTVNSLSKLKQPDKALEFAEKLGEALEMYGKMLYSKYLIFYYNTLVANYSIQNPKMGLKALLEMEKEISSEQMSVYRPFIVQNKALLNHQLENYEEALRFLRQSYKLPNFKSADPGYKIRIFIVELIFLFDAMDFKELNKKLIKVNEMIGEQAKTDAYKYELLFLLLMEELVSRKSSKIQRYIDRFLKLKIPVAQQDLQIINYQSWCIKRFKTDA